MRNLDIADTRGWRLACVTNKPTDFARARAARSHRPAHFFAFTFGGDAFARRKPDPLPLLEACRAGQRAPHTLMIGDSSNDAAAARAAGCPVLLATYGYNHGEPVARVDADGFFARLDEIGC